MSVSLPVASPTPVAICRALYDFTSPDASALSFRNGDEIKVYTMLPSGWWDGVRGEKRGWFPSNYVQVIDQLPPPPLQIQSRNRFSSKENVRISNMKMRSNNSLAAVSAMVFYYLAN